MAYLTLDHVQIAMPAGEEDAALACDTPGARTRHGASR
jgi:hypothetical protein